MQRVWSASVSPASVIGARFSTMGKQGKKLVTPKKIQRDQGQPIDIPDPSPNADYYNQVNDMVQTLFDDCHEFADIFHGAPLPLSGGAREAPFCQDTFTEVMTKAKEYKVGGNLFWLDMGNKSRTPGSSVPLSQKNITFLMDHYFVCPRFFSSRYNGRY